LLLTGLTQHELVLIEDYLRFHQAQDDYLRFCQTHTADASFSETCSKAQATLAQHADNIAKFLITTDTERH
jgi:hypothetical protein